MKRILSCMMVLLLALSLPTYAEGVTMYQLSYNDSMVEDWYKSAYPFPETLLYLNQNEDQVLVMSLDKQQYASADAYIADYIDNVKGYANVTISSGPADWNAPWGSVGKVSGFTSEIIEGDETYISKYRLYAADYEDALFVVEMTFSQERDDEWIGKFADTFLDGQFAIRKETADELKTAYVKAMEVGADGSLVLTVDYVELVAGEDEYDYTIQDDGNPEVQVTASANAQIYIPDVENFGESVRIENPAAAVAAFNACYAQNPEVLFELVFKDGLVVWMDDFTMM